MINCKAKQVGGTIVFAVNGDIIFGHLDKIRVAVRKNMEDAATNMFLLDISAVGKIDSARIGFIVFAYKTMHSRRGFFRSLVRTKR
jgi:anti-anti-sigma factor